MVDHELTDKARRELGLPTSRQMPDVVLVPLLDVPWRDDRHDRKPARPQGDRRA